MLIIPAIDLLQGACVRLKQGQFDEVTAFTIPPVERAAYFAQAGAKRLHIVDLDGARTGSMQQLPLITAMQNTGIEVQVGGGIRTVEQAQDCVMAGISRLVIGSIAITDPEVTQKIIKVVHPEHIVLALDVRIEKNIPIPAINGWQKNSRNTLWELVSFYQPLGITEILCTDISCDGMMAGPNFNLYQQAVERFPDIAWQASGGIRSVEDISRLSHSGVTAAVLGLTLYSDNFNLAGCLAEFAQ